MCCVYCSAGTFSKPKLNSPKWREEKQKIRLNNGRRSENREPARNTKRKRNSSASIAFLVYCSVAHLASHMLHYPIHSTHHCCDCIYHNCLPPWLSGYCADIECYITRTTHIRAIAPLHRLCAFVWMLITNHAEQCVYSIYCWLQCFRNSNNVIFQVLHLITPKNRAGKIWEFEEWNDIFLSVIIASGTQKTAVRFQYTRIRARPHKHTRMHLCDSTTHTRSGNNNNINTRQRNIQSHSIK